MEWIGLILEILLLGIFLIWEGYNKKKGENFAMKEDSRVHIPEHTRSLSGSLLGYKTIP